MKQKQYAPWCLSSKITFKWITPNLCLYIIYWDLNNYWTQKECRTLSWLTKHLNLLLWAMLKISIYQNSNSVAYFLKYINEVICEKSRVCQIQYLKDTGRFYCLGQIFDSLLQILEKNIIFLEKSEIEHFSPLFSHWSASFLYATFERDWSLQKCYLKL